MKLDKTGMTNRKKKDLMESNKFKCKKKKSLLIINWKMWDFVGIHCQV